MRSMFRAFLAFALALAGGGAFAQVSASDAAFDRFYAQVTGVGKQTVSYGSGGQLVVGQGVPQISSSGGPVNVDRSIPLRNNSGGQIAANARFAIPPAALGKIIRAGVVLSPYLVAGVALYDLAKELGFQVEKSGADVAVYKPDPGVCTVSPCYSYTVTAGSVVGRGGSASAACNDWIAKAIANDGNARTLIDVTETTCRWTGPAWGGSPFSLPVSKASVPPYTGPLPSSSLSELEAAIASKSGWPSTSKISQAVADATALQPAPAIQAVPQVTGPATSPGETKTKANPDGSTTTTTTTHNHTYTGPTVNTTTTTVTSTCTGGSCNTTTETETPKLDDQPFAMPCGVAGTPACAVKVDETGVPDATNVNADRLRDLEEQNADWIEGLVAANPFPDINWAFELPTACGVIPTPAFAPAVDGIDVCQFQPMFHELMTVVWMLGGLFGAISLFMRNALTT